MGAKTRRIDQAPSPVESQPAGVRMEFGEAAKELRDIIAAETVNDVETLRERVQRISVALEKRAGTNQYQQLLVRAAVSGIIRYFDHGRPRNEREELLRTLFRLERAAAIEREPPTDEHIRLDNPT